MDKKEMVTIFNEFKGLRSALEEHCRLSGLQFRFADVKTVLVQKLDDLVFLNPPRYEGGLPKKTNDNEFNVKKIFFLTRHGPKEILPSLSKPFQKALEQANQEELIAVLGIDTTFRFGILGYVPISVEHLIQICKNPSHRERD